MTWGQETVDFGGAGSRAGSVLSRGRGGIRH